MRKLARAQQVKEPVVARPAPPVSPPVAAKVNDLVSGRGPVRLDINFASEVARKLAYKHDLHARDFQGREYSGRTGYTIGDVRALLTERGEI
jgi:hypothetical protein